LTFASRHIGDQFDRIISRHLAAGAAPADAGCLEASVIAAYRDRSLPRDERSGCEQHLARCARCSGVLAAMVRIGDAGASGAEAIARRGWWRQPQMLSLATLGAVAIVLAVVILKAGRPSGLTNGSLEYEQKSKSLEANAETDRLKSPPAETNPSIAMNEAADAGLAAPQRVPSPVQGAATNNAPANSAGQPPAALGAQTAPMTTAPLASPPMAETAKAQAALPSAAGAPAVPAASRSAISEMVGAAIGAAIPGGTAVVVEPPDHSTVWMVGAKGSISRYSPHSGWVPQASGVTADLTAGSALSPTICWIVGRGGTILRTLDGEHWTKTNSPVTSDLASVIATGTDAATIATPDGRRFTTANGGATWDRR
jgi:hypothetical protein